MKRRLSIDFGNFFNEAVHIDSCHTAIRYEFKSVCIPSPDKDIHASFKRLAERKIYSFSTV